MDNRCVVRSRDRIIKSTSIKCNFPPFLDNYDRPTDQSTTQTDDQTSNSFCEILDKMSQTEGRRTVVGPHLYAYDPQATTKKST